MLVIFTQHSVSAYNALHTFPELSYIPHNSIVNILIILRAALFRSILLCLMKINIFVITFDYFIKRFAKKRISQVLINFKEESIFYSSWL